MPVPVSSLQSVNPSPIIELFELTLDPVLHGTTSIQDPDGNNISTIDFITTQKIKQLKLVLFGMETHITGCLLKLLVLNMILNSCQDLN